MIILFAVIDIKELLRASFLEEHLHCCFCLLTSTSTEGGTQEDGFVSTQG